MAHGKPVHSAQGIFPAQDGQDRDQEELPLRNSTGSHETCGWAMPAAFWGQIYSGAGGLHIPVACLASREDPALSGGKRLHAPNANH